MSKPLFAPIPIEYSGLYADDYLIDAQHLGSSLVGLSRITNVLVHFWLQGEVPRPRALYQARVFVGPPKKGSIIYEVLALMASGSLPLYAPLLCEVAETAIAKIFKAIVDLRIGRANQADEAIDAIVSMAHQHQEFAKIIHDGHMRDKAWLQAHISQISSQLTTPLRELPEPVGRSCRAITLGRTREIGSVTIDEPIAEVLQSKEKLEVGESMQIKGKFLGVDKTNGACKVETSDSERPVKGKITDPAIAIPNNIYTHSLDIDQGVILTAKPVLKDGEVIRLYISDAKLIKK